MINGKAEIRSPEIEKTHPLGSKIMIPLSEKRALEEIILNLEIPAKNAQGLVELDLLRNQYNSRRFLRFMLMGLEYMPLGEDKIQVRLELKRGPD